MLEKKFSELSKEICIGQSFTIGNQTFNEAGNYSIRFTSSKGCDSIVHLTLIVHPLPVIDAVSDKASALTNDPIQLNVLTTETLSYNWTPVNLVSNPSIQNPAASITAPTWFVVTATNETTQCRTTDSVYINIEYLPCTKEHIFIPNAFTPNGDGVNDKLYVRTTILKSIHLEIYDRWGHKVYETDTLTEGWDGNYKGQPAPMDAYGYYLKGECLQGDEIILKGNFTLLR